MNVGSSTGRTTMVFVRTRQGIFGPMQLAESVDLNFGAIYSSSPEYRSCTKDSGNRLLTALGYLCNLPSPTCGGGTQFTKLGFHVEPELGKLLVFHNCYAAQDADVPEIAQAVDPGEPSELWSTVAKRHPLSEHAGMVVHEGEKLAFNLWFRERDTKSGFCSL